MSTFYSTMHTLTVNKTFTKKFLTFMSPFFLERVRLLGCFFEAISPATTPDVPEVGVLAVNPSHGPWRDETNPQFSRAAGLDYVDLASGCRFRVYVTPALVVPPRYASRVNHGNKKIGSRPWPDYAYLYIRWTSRLDDLNKCHILSPFPTMPLCFYLYLWFVNQQIYRFPLYFYLSHWKTSPNILFMPSLNSETSSRYKILKFFIAREQETYNKFLVLLNWIISFSSKDVESS